MAVLGVLRRESGPGRMRVSRQYVMGLPVMYIGVPSGGRREARRLEKAARLLRQQGVTRVLPVRGFEGWEALADRGISPVEGLALYRNMADMLALAMLERKGLQPHAAAVALRGTGVGPELVRAARLLCPRVRELVIDGGAGGQRLAEGLYREFGAAVRLGGGHGADAAVCFDGPAQDGEIGLGRQALCLQGLELTAPGIPIPDWLEPVPALCALWQAGRLAQKDVQVRF